MTNKINVLLGDITTLNVDIIVNAANESLLGGGGVDGAIHRKAGPKLLEECRTLNGCKTGEAKMTLAYNLPCRRIIHTVGPIYFKNIDASPNLLKKCYINSMDLAEKYRKSSNLEEVTIAFPCISTGIYGYPKEEACNIAVDTIKEIDNDKINVKFICFDQTDYNLYQKKLKENEKIKRI